jgi:glycosyltransferase involved in cell wall biosynthesis
MDGIEWSRARWGFARQAILYVNERIACVVGNQLIADHPEIETYLQTRAPRRKISMITYGANAVTAAPTEGVTALGLAPGRFLTMICRPIPENSVRELVAGFSSRPRGMRLAVLGAVDAATDPYHADVVASASDEVDFLGAIYDPQLVAALRFHSALYLHGHTVGGTNPSLVEAMAAGNPVLAHDNPYNRWTAGPHSACYFSTVADVDRVLTELLPDAGRLAAMRAASRSRYDEEFTWARVAGQYEQLLLDVLDRTAGHRRPT